MTGPAIRLEGITKSYRVGSVEVPVLRGVELSVAEAQSVAITGGSGSGKSTLMNIVGLLDRPSSGLVEIGGREIGEMSNDEMASVRNATIGFVFQSFHLMPRLSAVDNVALPLLYRSVPRGTARAEATAMLDRVGLTGELARYPHELSGGQRQRVAVARALVGEPTVVLADEPTGALDADTGDAVLELLLEMGERRGACVVLITHDPKVAERCGRETRLANGVLVDAR